MCFIELRNKPSEAFDENNIAIALSSSDQYVPYLSVVLQSIIENSQKKNNYDIIVLHKEITDENKRIVTEQCNRENISIRFFDMSKLIENKKFYCGNVKIETYFRIFLPDVLEEYDKVVFLDCDIVVNRDISELFNINIEDYYIGAVRDLNIIGCYNIGREPWRTYLSDELNIKNPFNYVQAGVLLINLKKFREDFDVYEIVDLCTRHEWRLQDQDVFNFLCQPRIKILDLKWNIMTGEEGRSVNLEVNAPLHLAEDYLHSKKDPYIIHYCGRIKPWIATEIQYATYFWQYARKSPYYEIILERKNRIDVKRFLDNSIKTIKENKECKISKVSSDERKIVKYVEIPKKIKTRKQVALFRVLTVYQLINAINIKTSLLKKQEVDLILTKATDFSNIVEKLIESRIFRNVFISEDSPETYFEWKRCDKNEQEQMLRTPEKYLYNIELPEVYTDYYIGTTDLYNKLFYYNLVLKGMRPHIHIFEDGLSTYLMDIREEARTDIWDHNLYGKYNFVENIAEVLLYEPKLYMGYGYSTKRIPKIDYIKNNISARYKNIFGINSLAEEKYIFLEEPFLQDGITATDMELVDALADIVGKENIRVKLHPRSQIDRFSPRGYKIFEKTKIPWEITMMTTSLENHVLVTVSSTAAMTAGFVFDKKFYAINLFDAINLGSTIHVRNSKFRDFYKQLEKIFNREKLQILKPRSIEEMREAIIYIEGEME